MPRRAGQAPQPDNSRNSILQAWIERHSASIKVLGGRSSPLVTKRLKALVGHTTGAFSDMPALIHSSGKGAKIGWQAEAYSPDGDPVRLFMELLERLGPAAIEIVAIGRKALADPALRKQLIDRGIPAGKANGELDHFLALDRGGEALITRLGDEVALRIPDATPLSRESLLRIAQDPHVLEDAVTSFLTAAVHTASLIAQARTTSTASDIWVANSDGEAVRLDEGPGPDGSEALIAAAIVLCEHDCGMPGECQRRVTPELFDDALYALVRRWAKSDTANRMREQIVILDREAKTRFAHTLLHPQYFRYVHEPTSDTDPRESWRALDAWFETDGIPLLQRKARSAPGLNADNRADLEQQNIADNLERLRRIYLDSYVDPRREPDDWGLVRREVTTLRDVGAFYTHGPPEGPPWPPPRGQAPVEDEYWMTRDLPMTQTADYQQFLRSSRRRRQPYATIDELSFLTSRLLHAADEELGLRQRDRLLNTHELEAAETWVAENLEATLLPVYRQIAKHTRVARERARRGVVVPAVDIEAAVMADCPSETPLQDWRAVALVTRLAFGRAVVVVFGRRGIDQAGDWDA